MASVSSAIVAQLLSLPISHRRGRTRVTTAPLVWMDNAAAINLNEIIQIAKDLKIVVRFQISLSQFPSSFNSLT